MGKYIFSSYIYLEKMFYLMCSTLHINCIIIISFHPLMKPYMIVSSFHIHIIRSHSHHYFQYRFYFIDIIYGTSKAKLIIHSFVCCYHDILLDISKQSYILQTDYLLYFFPTRLKHCSQRLHFHSIKLLVPFIYLPYNAVYMINQY